MKLVRVSVESLIVLVALLVLVGALSARPIAMKLVRVSVGSLIVLLTLLVLVGALSARPADPRLYPPAEGEASVTVYVVRNWLHSTLAVPRQPLRDASSGPAAAALDRLPAGEWIRIGWGDAKHYRERGDSPARSLSLVRSLVVPDNPAVISLDVGRDPPTPWQTGRRIVRLELSAEGFQRLARRLDSSFELTPVQGVPSVAGRGRAPESLFFYSNQTADLFFTCNHWIGYLLNAAGVPTTPLAEALSLGLALSLKLRAGAEDLPGPVGAGTEPAFETPPVHSGRFRPMSAPARELGAIVFESYAVTIGDTNMQTRPVGLAPARAPTAPGGRQWSEVLKVPPTSLVERREMISVDPNPMLCDGAPVTEMVLGFRVSARERYEIAVAVLSGAELCEVLQFMQP